MVSFLQKLFGVPQVSKYEDLVIEDHRANMSARAAVLDTLGKDCPYLHVENGCPNCGGVLREEPTSRWFRCVNSDCGITLGYCSHEVRHTVKELKEIQNASQR